MQLDMTESFVRQIDGIYNTETNVYNSIFEQYERVIIQSLITSFGLDFLVHDQHGGDVDTIHTVGQIGKDEQMKYKKKKNKNAYNNRGEYDEKCIMIPIPILKQKRARLAKSIMSMEL